MTVTRWKLTIEYEGTDFRGWQRQKAGVPSVQQAVEEALYGFCQKPLTIHAAGRTDAGVHARGQVVHFDLDYGDRPLTGFDLAKALNAHLKPQPVVVVDAAVVADDFHARFDAMNKLYIYRIINRPAPAALDHGKAWHIKRPLDVAAMQEAASYMTGYHDFTSFRDSECQAKSPMRTLDRLDVQTQPYDHYGALEIRILAEARSFLHHQVRNMTGTLAKVGEGKIKPAAIKDILAAKDRCAAGPTAPAAGLYLVRIDYPGISSED